MKEDIGIIIALVVLSLCSWGTWEGIFFIFHHLSFTWQ